MILINPESLSGENNVLYTFFSLSNSLHYVNYYANTQVSGEGCSVGKGGRKEKRTSTSKVDELSYNGNEYIIGRPKKTD